MIGDRIRAARKNRRLSLRALAREVGVSHQAIYKYEHNKDMPSSDVLISLSYALGMKPEYFFREDRPLEIAPVFRKHPCLSAKSEKRILSNVLEWLERYLEIERLLPSAEPASFPPALEISRIRSIDDIEIMADQLRILWELGTGPIPKLMELLEDKGIQVASIESRDDAFDACGFWGKDPPDHLSSQDKVGSDFGSAAIVIRRNGVPGDRQRFSMAHELGHLLLQWLDNSCPFSPEQAATSSAVSQSIQAWLKRALELDIISEALKSRLFKELKAQDALRVEPGEQVPPEEPGRLRRMAWRAVAEGIITRSRASELAQISM